MEDCELVLADEVVRLMPERALFWPRTSTLFVADTHWGKAATFRAASIPIPPGGEEKDLRRLSAALERTKAERLVILGDLLHARQGRCERTFEIITAWRAGLSSLEIVLVQGNHDRHAGRPLDAWGMQVCQPPRHESPFVWQHEPTPSEAGFVLAGHIHPAVRLQGRARETFKLPCFHRTEHALTLPAFSSFAAGKLMPALPGETFYALSDDAVFECPAAGRVSSSGR